MGGERRSLGRRRLEPGMQLTRYAGGGCRSDNSEGLGLANTLIRGRHASQPRKSRSRDGETTFYV